MLTKFTNNKKWK